MKTNLILLFTLFIPILVFAENASNKYFYSFACQITDLNGKLVKRFPGGLCTHFNNGITISSTQETLIKYGPDGNLVWIKYVNGHHNLKKLDENHFLLLTSSINDYKNRRTRFDRISLFNLDGEEEKFFDFFEHWKEILSLARNKNFLEKPFPTFQSPSSHLPAEIKKNFKPTFFEFSHANSIYRISKNKLSVKIPAFEEGNFLVNVNGLQFTFILSKDFKSILWSIPYPEPNGDNLHDVQIDQSGEFLIFYNNYFTKTSSAIEKYDPISKKRTVLFKANEEFNFFGETQGGVQEIEDRQLLISQFNPKSGGKIFIVGKDGKVIWQMIPTKQGTTGDSPLDGLQEIKKIELNQFFKNQK